MDGIHDLGGRQGFGPVRHSPDAPAFHGEWEKRVNALYSLAVRLGVFNMDEYRHAIERMEPRHYLSASYYERSLTSLATLCVEKGLVTREELERRAGGAFPLALASAPRPRERRGARALRARRPRSRQADHVARPRADAGLHPRQDRRRRRRVARRIRSPTRTRTASPRTTSRRTTCASAAPISGRLGRRGVRARRRLPELSRARRLGACTASVGSPRAAAAVSCAAGCARRSGDRRDAASPRAASDRSRAPRRDWRPARTSPAARSADRRAARP